MRSTLPNKWCLPINSDTVSFINKARKSNSKAEFQKELRVGDYTYVYIDEDLSTKSHNLIGGGRCGEELTLEEFKVLVLKNTTMSDKIFKAGDLVVYNGEETVIVQKSKTNSSYWVVKYSKGWSATDNNREDLPSGIYHFAGDSSLKHSTKTQSTSLLKSDKVCFRGHTSRISSEQRAIINRLYSTNHLDFNSSIDYYYVSGKSITCVTYQPYGYTETTFLEFLKMIKNETSSTSFSVFPEKWAVLADSSNAKEIGKLFDQALEIKDIYTSSHYVGQYFHSHNFADESGPIVKNGVSIGRKGGSNHVSKTLAPGFTEITFEEFQKWVTIKTSTTQTSTEMEITKKEDLKVGVWYCFLSRGFNYYLKFLELEDDKCWSSEYISSGYHTVSRGHMLFSNSFVTVASFEDVAKSLKASHPDASKSSFPKHYSLSSSTPLVFGVYKVGDLLVSLADVGSGRSIGDMFIVLADSSATRVSYKLSHSSSESSEWRKATSEEEAAYQRGIRNINQITNSSYKVGDRVVYQGEETIIVVCKADGNYIVEYSKGWPGRCNSSDYGELKHDSLYHHCSKENLKPSTASGTYKSTQSSYQSTESPKRWSVGDTVTYKKNEDCYSKEGKSGSYYDGGRDFAGFRGTIESYNNYVSEKKCWRIDVTTPKGYAFSMLECEFEEYDGSYTAKADTYTPVSSSKYEVGDKVSYEGEICPILLVRSNGHDDHDYLIEYSDGWRGSDDTSEGVFTSSSKRYYNVDHDEVKLYSKGSPSSSFGNPCVELISVNKDKKSSILETVPHQKEVLLTEVKTTSNRLVTI